MLRKTERQTISYRNKIASASADTEVDMKRDKQLKLYHHPDAEAILRAILKHAKKTNPEGLRAAIDRVNAESPLIPECNIDFDQI